jgi:hypothetical protein
MLLLVVDVFHEPAHVGRADGKCRIAALPVEVGQAGPLGFDPFRRIPFQLADECGHVKRFSKAAEKVNVVLDARAQVVFVTAPTRSILAADIHSLGTKTPKS